MSGWTFYLPLVFGGVILAVEAHRLFYDPTLKKVISRGRFPILEGVELDNLAPRRVQTRGWLFYIGIYLLIFGIAVSVTEFGDLLYEASRSSEQAGAQGALPTNSEFSEFIGGSGNWRPLAIAMAMIALMSARSQAGHTVRALESALRNYAHRLAGIPHSIYRLITRLNNVDYREAISESDAVYFQLFQRIRDKIPDEVANLEVLRKKLDETSYNLLAIDVLMPSITGDRAFAVEVAEKLTELIKKQSLECKSLTNDLESVASDSNPVVTPEQADILRDKVENCLRNTKAVFSVLYSQSNRRTIGESDSPTAYVVRYLNQPDRFRLKDKAVLSILLVLFIFIIVYPIFEIFYQNFKMRDGFFSYGFLDKIGDLLVNTVYFLFQATLLLMVASLIAVSVRRSALDAESWNDNYTLSNLPVTRLLKASIWPAVLAACVVLVMNVCLDLILTVYGTFGLPSVKVLSHSISVNFEVALVHAPLGLIASVVVLLVSDLHNKLETRDTVTLAALFAVPFLLVAAIGYLIIVSGSLQVGDTEQEWTHEQIVWLVRALMSAGLLSLYALMAFCGFAWLVEWAEDEVERAD